MADVEVAHRALYTTVKVEWTDADLFATDSAAIQSVHIAIDRHGGRLR